jgi:hypothetical protein
LATGALTGFFSEELLEPDELLLELEAALFLATTFFSSAFLFLFLVSSTDCFLDGASDEDADATFFA